MTSSNIKTTTLRAEGFSCPSCVSKIETKLLTLDGVHEAEVKFSSGRIIVKHSPSVRVKQLVNAVAEVGYQARPSVI
ncbi:Putative metal-binding protein [Corynebacterium camporealensis]|uniref:Putative metal-binding protein n=1 Tax=Corynebacterium camporealensis TaxID=161896 RepID=A0A0F6T9B5_9CORY|nr:heavy metal-associated domain-containing protein [Corynebacterium camporealensis]AKE38019.1 putative metal-binding protein [Corynebacterium camporealensis]AVH87350.1 Putative metal-binding protein [Corynebacterium camporealensis]